MSEIDLTEKADLIEQEYAADQARRFHEAEAEKYERVRDQVRAELRRLMGTHEIALVHGKEVLKRTLSKQFADARFRKAHPDIWEDYKTPRLKYELDMDRLRKDLPDLVAQFSTERWTNNSEVL